MHDEWLWWCPECDKWFTDMQVFACCQSAPCPALVCPECETPVLDRKPSDLREQIQQAHEAVENGPKWLKQAAANDYSARRVTRDA